MGTDEVGECARIVAVVPDQQLEGVGHDQDELDLRRCERDGESLIRLPPATPLPLQASRMDAYHLQHGEILLPPEVLLYLRSHGGQHVVRVHDDVHEGIQQAEERAVTTCGVYGAREGQICIKSSRLFAQFVANRRAA